MHMKTWIYPLYFATCGRPKPRYARNQFFFTIWHLRVPFVSHQNLGDSKEILEIFFWGSVANKYLGKVTEAFQKNPSSFGAVVRKPGLGGKLPHTCNARVKTTNPCCRGENARCSCKFQYRLRRSVGSCLFRLPESNNRFLTR